MNQTTLKMLLTNPTSIFTRARLNTERAKEIRSQVVDSLAEYCAELSFIAFHEFADETAGKIDALPINRKWHRIFKQYLHKIRSKGAAEVGGEILSDLNRQMA